MRIKLLILALSTCGLFSGCVDEQQEALDAQRNQIAAADAEYFNAQVARDTERYKNFQENVKALLAHAQYETPEQIERDCQLVQKWSDQEEQRDQEETNAEQQRVDRENEEDYRERVLDELRELQKPQAPYPTSATVIHNGPADYIYYH
jgi:hypothetical protein